MRKEVREMIEPLGGFILVHVATPLEDLRGARPQGPLRQGARRDPQAVHRHLRSLRGRRPTPRSSIDTTEVSPEEAAQQILLYLEKEGYVGGKAGA